MDQEYPDVGLTYFDFNQFQPDRVAKENHAYGYPFLKLLMKLWPGNWNAQRAQINDRIDAVNEETKKKKKKSFHVIRKVTKREFWVFVGLLIAASAHRLGGHLLWEKDRDIWTATEPINYGIDGKEVMPEYRFRDLRQVFPYGFQDKDAEDDGDPWHMIRGMVNGYNLVRSLWVAASLKKVMDETMSAWCPRTTKFGGLPHISWICRKPEPLGTEFKTVACSSTGIILHCEIQEGEKAMKAKKYGGEFGGTVACTFRLIEAAVHCGKKWRSRKQAALDNKSEYFIGDSWFTSVPVVEWLSEKGHNYCGAMKSNYRLFPKAELEAKMKVGAVVLPLHNHARQGELKMEKRWVTHDCWFRLGTTLISMTVTDCWKAFRHHVADDKAKEMTVVGFADRVASDCLRNKFPDTIEADDNLNLMPTPVLTVEVPTGNGVPAADGISPISVATTIEDLSNGHTRIVNPDLQASGRPKRRTCRADGCRKETHWLCGNQACMSEAYNANGRRVRGMFYCDAHWPLEHWKDLHPTSAP
ncbi:unknown protein [Seminavis robusta]|uniref:PiggyBac transposable element-derived protein domain-containing protein n=1 Tax=Seminavis robusta TaxID=568900 RepID=A0A9N8DC50_9STRA|nr:unknown protein [Seminavis robusta]|eukprot:Sro31_g020010.1 n/a (528) ;mRNA; r:7687-9500